MKLNLVIINEMTARVLFTGLFDAFEEKFPFIDTRRSNWYLDSDGFIWTDGALEGLSDMFVRIEGCLEVNRKQVNLCCGDPNAN